MSASADPDTLFRTANRLGKVSAGSAAADWAIHDALGLPGEPPPYTTDEAAMRTLLPPGYEMTVIDHSTGGPYAACILAMGGAVVRCRGALIKWRAASG